jgi:hypothetical protein
MVRTLVVHATPQRKLHRFGTGLHPFSILGGAAKVHHFAPGGEALTENIINGGRPRCYNGFGRSK